MGIMAIISGAGILSYNKILEDNSLYDSTERLLFVMQQSIENAKQNVSDSRHGVHIGGESESEFHSFVGDTYETSTSQQIYTLPDKVLITNVDFNNGTTDTYKEIAFSQGTGKPSLSHGEIKISIRNKPDKYIFLTMNSEGIWTVEQNY